jgi:hypothetical protein
MRPNVTQQNPWAQFGIAACALVLPPLALGAALYSMLAAPEDGGTRPAGAPVTTQPALPDTPGPAALNTEPPKVGAVVEPVVGQSAEEVARKWNQILVQGTPGQVGPGQVTSGQVTSGQANSGQITPGQVNLDQLNSGQVNPVQVTSAQAAAGNPRTAAGTPAPAEGPLASPAPKRANRRHSRQQQEEYPLQNWLQQMGILPRNSSGGG